MSGAKGAGAVAAHRHQGAVVYGELTPAALAAGAAGVQSSEFTHQAAHVTSPPLRHDSQTPFVLMDMLARFAVVDLNFFNFFFN